MPRVTRQLLPAVANDLKGNVTLSWDVISSDRKPLNTSAFLPWFISRSRIFLYLSDPYEESFEFEHQVADYHTETLPLLVAFVFLEWFVLWLKGKPLPLLGDSFASAAMIIFMECTRILTRGLEHTAYVYIYKNYRIIDLPWDSAITWYLAAIFVDFCYYWGHRASHEINVLWAQHQAHHSAESYSLVNTFRLPFTQDWLYAFCYLPMALVISPAHYLVHIQLNLLYQFWLHTSVIGKLGPLEWILNTPSHHRVHHGSNKHCLDKNYAAWLIIWDRMFGTFQEERDGEEIVYGLVDPVHSFNPFYLQIFYFGKIFEKWRAMDGWKNKLYSLIKGPGWRPGAPWTGFLDEVPEVKGRQPYTYAPFPLWWSVYLFTHFFIVLFAYEGISMFRNHLTPLAVFCHLAYVIFSLTAWGLVYDRNRWAPVVEFVRCAFLLFYSRDGLPILTNFLTWTGLTHAFGSSLEFHIFCALRLYFFVSGIIWGLIFAFSAFEKALSAERKKTD